eukprot:gene8496-8678_t
MLVSGSDRATTRSGRSECYKARDAFYQCVRESGLLYSSKTAIPTKCKHLRALFESACLASWVKHFDELQEQQARAVQNLHKTINTKAATSAGNLAGTSQQ